MALTNAQRIKRLEKRLEELALWTRSAIPLDRWSFNGTPISRDTLANAKARRSATAR